MSIFSSIRLKKPRKSVHNLSYASKMSLDFGRLCPIYLEKVVPGDKFRHRHEMFMRFAPFKNQVFQEFKCETFYFFVPSRLLWQDFEKFISSDTQFVHPYIDFQRFYNIQDMQYYNVLLNNSIFDYFNLPSDKQNIVNQNKDRKTFYIDALPFLAYVKIYLEFFADQNLNLQEMVADVQKVIDIVTSAGGDCTDHVIELFQSIHNYLGDNQYSSQISTFQPFLKSYPKDYFTSALPTAQLGAPVSIPLNSEGDVIITQDGGSTRYANVGMDFNAQTGEVTFKNANSSITPGVDSPPLTLKCIINNNVATIQDLRSAVVVAQFLEKQGYAGHRYKERIKSSFGVTSKDYRLDRAELIQKNTSTISLGEVFTTSFSDDAAAKSIPGMPITTAKSSSVTKDWNYKVYEHGYIIGLIAVYPKAAYYQGIPRQFQELDQYDYFFPEFQHIGEQEINVNELFAASPIHDTFGYTPRYSQYKYRCNQIHGDFRTSLEFMHDARKLNSPPVLNDQFILIHSAYNNLHRVFNATGVLGESQPVYIDMFHNVKALRPMDYYGLPKFINGI